MTLFEKLFGCDLFPTPVGYLESRAKEYRPAKVGKSANSTANEMNDVETGWAAVAEREAFRVTTTLDADAHEAAMREVISSSVSCERENIALGHGALTLRKFSMCR